MRQFKITWITNIGGHNMPKLEVVLVQAESLYSALMQVPVGSQSEDIIKAEEIPGGY